MLTELLQYLRNWFRLVTLSGTIVIEDGKLSTINGIDCDTLLLDGQYFRVLGSAVNDGVYQQNTCELTDETFSGALWLLGIPAAVVALADEIERWQTEYGKVAASPMSSESFGGYSYSKASGGASGDTSWQTAFASRLTPWRKI